MSTSNPTSFCPRCNQQVLLARKEFDTCLAIVLLFTGIGILIYLAVYFSKKPDRCAHCGTQITFSQQQVQFQQPTSRNISEETNITTPNYCPLCGEKLEALVKYCANCGGKIP